MIYIIYGANSIGKKTLRDAIMRNYGLECICKYTNSTDEREDDALNLKRDKFLLVDLDKNGEPLELNVFREKYKKDFIYFRTKGNKKNPIVIGYAIKKKELEIAINDKENDYLLVVSDYSIVKQIKDFIRDSFGHFNVKNELNTLIKVIFIAGDVRNKDDIDNSRTWSNADVINTNQKFNEKVGEFDGVIMYPTVMQEKDRFVKPFEQWEKIANVLPKHVRTKAFIVRPFSNEYEEENRSVHSYIEDLLKKYNIEVNKYEYPCNESIMKTVEKLITCAGLIFVDLRHHKPNCYYELGYARGLQKEIITIVPENQTDEVAFDVKGYNYYTYNFECFGGKPRSIYFCSGTKKGMEIEGQIKSYCKRNHIPTDQE